MLNTHAHHANTACIQNSKFIRESARSSSSPSSSHTLSPQLCTPFHMCAMKSQFYKAASVKAHNQYKPNTQDDQYTMNEKHARVYLPIIIIIIINTFCAYVRVYRGRRSCALVRGRRSIIIQSHLCARRLQFSRSSSCVLVVVSPPHRQCNHRINILLSCIFFFPHFFSSDSCIRKIATTITTTSNNSNQQYIHKAVPPAYCTVLNNITT